jgi:hypothetical protein
LFPHIELKNWFLQWRIFVSERAVRNFDKI